MAKLPEDTQFLGLEEILEIHQEQLKHYGGSPGVRDMGLLQSALAMPMCQFGGEFLHRDLFEKAAAYLFHLVQNHPFVDANKRTGAMAADVFLAMNGIQLRANQKEFGDLVLAVAGGKTDKKSIARFFEQNTST